MITRFRVQNYKALRDVTLDLTPVHVLIGPNDSGKTSLLQSISLLSRIVDHPLELVFPQISSRMYVKFTASWDTAFEGINGYHVGVFADGFSNKGVPKLAEEYFLLNDTHVLQIGGGMKNAFAERPSSLHQLKSNGYSEAVLDQIQATLSGVHFYRFSSESLKMPVVLDSRRQGRMEMNGLGLPQLLDEIRNDRVRFTALEDRFCAFFPYVTAIELRVEDAFASSPKDHRQVQRSEYASGKGIVFRLKDGGKLAAEDASDGMFLVLAYLALLNLPNPPRFLLIEEPENGIHPARLKEIIRILKQLVSEQSHTQVLMTTHSPYVLSEFQPEEVTLCRREENGEVKVRRLSESRSVHDLKDVFNLGEIWTIDGDDKLMLPVDPSTPEAINEQEVSNQL